jgi:hypothetical protein
LAIILSTILSALRLAFGVGLDVGVAGRLLLLSVSRAGKSSSCKDIPLGCFGCDSVAISFESPLSVADDFKVFFTSETGVAGFDFMGD